MVVPEPEVVPVSGNENNFVTHSYLLLGEEQPNCVGVRHFRLECDNFSQIRNKYYKVNIMKWLFQEYDVFKEN